MLTGDLVRPRLRRRGDQLVIQWLDYDRYERTASELIALFKEVDTQGTWDSLLATYEGTRTDYIVIRGLAKVISDAATFEMPETPVDPADLRARLFAEGPVFTYADLFTPRTRVDLMREVAESYGTTPDALEAALFADRPAAYRLTDSGPDWTPRDLIDRYNLELARAALYYADEIHLEIYDTFKDFWRYVKLFKLMFEGTPISGGYHIRLDGPISPFVRSTTRYGRQFAAFLPALFLCEQWQMQASVRPPGFDSKVTYYLNHDVPLVSHFKRGRFFDSRMELDFAQAFHAKFGDERGKWTLGREDEVILLGDTVMIPDFSLTHASGQRLLIEIVGFWHPDYLRRKLAKVRAAGRDDLILLVYEGVNLTPDKLDDLPAQVLIFKNKPVLKDVLALAESMLDTES